MLPLFHNYFDPRLLESLPWRELLRMLRTQKQFWSIFYDVPWGGLFMKTMHTFIAATVLGLSASVTPASAVVLDFIDYIDEVTGETGGDPTVMSDPTHVSIATTVTGYSGTDGGIPVVSSSADVAYLDFGEAGIGVCGTLGAAVPLPNKGTNECSSGAGDDNLQSGEMLGFKWTTNMAVAGIGFRPEGHDVGFNSDGSDMFRYSIDDGVNWSFGNLVKFEDEANTGFFSFGTSLEIDAGDELLLGYSNRQYYVAGMSVTALPTDPTPGTSVVPLPASFLLLGLGLAGMGAMRRKRSQS